MAHSDECEASNPSERAPERMVIGLGIVLIVAGLVLAFDVVNIDTTAVDTETLGWILLVVGALAIVISLVVNQQRTRSTTVVERRDERPQV